MKLQLRKKPKQEMLSPEKTEEAIEVETVEVVVAKEAVIKEEEVEDLKLLFKIVHMENASLNTKRSKKMLKKERKSR